MSTPSPVDAPAVIEAHGLGKRFDIYLNDRSRLAEFLGRRAHHQEHWALRDISFSIQPGRSFGVVGGNGAGKSTLLKLVLDQLEPTHGTVTVQDGVKIGYFSQFSELDGSVSVMEVLSEVFAEVREVEAELAKIDTAMADEGTSADELDRLVERQAELFEDMARLDGWDVDREIDTALTKLGFNEAHRICPIDALSGLSLIHI